jgi:curved DNA-binding protein
MPDSSPRSVEDYYTILGVGRDATTQDIKKAFRKIARECHPDVAGDKAGARERFEDARRAYEVLVDPVERSRYDRRRQPRGRPFAGGWWGFPGAPPDADTSAGFHASSKPGNDIGLEDIFNDFGAFDDFGFGGSTGGAPRPGSSGPAPGAGAGPMPPPPRSADERRRDRHQGAEASPPEAGRDIELQARVPSEIAERGGLVTLRYQRLVRSDDGSALRMYDEIHDLRVPPGTEHGDVLRVPRQGHASLHGLPGELVCTVAIHRDRASEPGSPREPGVRDDSAAGHQGTEADPLPLPISVSEALLGGRVELDTPGGKVRLVVPPCTSSGTLLRLRGRNRSVPGDLYLRVEVVMPASLDEQSRELIMQFARMNSYDPRG